MTWRFLVCHGFLFSMLGAVLGALLALLVMAAPEGVLGGTIVGAGMGSFVGWHWVIRPVFATRPAAPNPS